jgi:hypothetical protein
MSKKACTTSKTHHRPVDESSELPREQSPSPTTWRNLDRRCTRLNTIFRIRFPRFRPSTPLTPFLLLPAPCPRDPRIIEAVAVEALANVVASEAAEAVIVEVEEDHGGAATRALEAIASAPRRRTSSTWPSTWTRRSPSSSMVAAKVSCVLPWASTTAEWLGWLGWLSPWMSQSREKG